MSCAHGLNLNLFYALKEQNKFDKKIPKSCCFFKEKAKIEAEIEKYV